MNFKKRLDDYIGTLLLDIFFGEKNTAKADLQSNSKTSYPEDQKVLKQTKMKEEWFLRAIKLIYKESDFRC